jgi:LuxR family quorum sensing-dependent transcriptional regulator
LSEIESGSTMLTPDARRTFEIAAGMLRTLPPLDGVGSMELLRGLVPFDSFCISALPIAGVGSGTQSFLAYGGSDEYFRTSLRERWSEHSAFVRAHQQAGEVIHTTDVARAATDRVMRDRFAVAGELLGGNILGVSLRLRSTRPCGAMTIFRHGEDFNDWDEYLLRIIAPGLHAAVAAQAPAEGSPRLTDRERECLSWASHGKTAWEISEILHISEHTATAHLNAAVRKLGAASRGHAIAEGLRWGIIT